MMNRILLLILISLFNITWAQKKIDPTPEHIAQAKELKTQYEDEILKGFSTITEMFDPYLGEWVKKSPGLEAEKRRRELSEKLQQLRQQQQVTFSQLQQSMQEKMQQRLTENIQKKMQ